MKKQIQLQRLIRTSLDVCLLAVVSPAALAVSDIDSHWAHSAMLKACNYSRQFLLS